MNLVPIVFQSSYPKHIPNYADALRRGEDIAALCDENKRLRTT